MRRFRLVARRTAWDWSVFVLALSIGAISLPELNAQELVQAKDMEMVNAFFRSDAPEKNLKGHFQQFRPALSFGFRHLSGYELRLPLKQYEGDGNQITVVARVTPTQGGQSKAFAQRYSFPPLDRKVDTDLIISGGFAVGVGDYVVDAGVVDSRERQFRAHWKIHVELGRSEKGVPLAMAANTIEPVMDRPWNGQSAPGSQRARLTVFLHVGPMNPFHVSMRSLDRAVLLRSLSSFLEQTPFQSIRLVAFNLDQQRELFQSDNFDAKEFRKLAGVLAKLELAKVDYHALQDPDGPQKLVSRLLSTEAQSTSPSDAVVIFGPRTRSTKKLEDQPAARTPGRPLVYHIELTPIWLMGSEFPDLLEYAVKSYGGSSIRAHNPGEFASAIQKLQNHLTGITTVSSIPRHRGQEVRP